MDLWSTSQYLDVTVQKLDSKLCCARLHLIIHLFTLYLMESTVVGALTQHRQRFSEELSNNLFVL